MRKLLTILFFLPLFALAQTCPGASKKLMVPPGGAGTGIYFEANTPGGWNMTIVPGDTLALQTGIQWDYFSSKFLTGTAQCPIIIMPSDTNDVVLIKNTITMEDAGHVKLSGRRPHDFDTTSLPTDNMYFGIKVEGLQADDPEQVAICIIGKSHDILAERVRVWNKNFGVWAKQDPKCDDTTYNYNGPGSFKMNHITIRQCDFGGPGDKGIESDCIYAGNTDPTGTARTYNCSGVTKTFVPMRLEYIDICYNRIRHAARTGIQLSGAETGFSRIHHNYISHVGDEWNNTQGDGIALGGMTRNCYVYNNTITNTFLYGVMDFGIEDNYVYNNIIDSVGLIDINFILPGKNPDSLCAALGYPLRFGHYLKNNNSNPANIYASTKQTVPDGYNKTIHYWNNQLGYNASTYDSLGAIDLCNCSIYQSRWTLVNEICGNTKMANGAAAHVQQFTYNPGTGNQSWPVYVATGCAPVKFKFSFKGKLSYKPRQ